MLTLIRSRVGTLGAGAVTNVNSGGWRIIFWMQAAFNLTSSLGLLLFYWPPKPSDYPKMSLWGYVWSCDPIGSLLFLVGATMTLLAFNWAGGNYPWSNAHVAAPLGLGLGLLILFCLYGKFSLLIFFRLKEIATNHVTHQNGKAAMMGCWHMCFSEAALILPYPCSHLR
jgi:hypothetical protein